jgi:hypothetical protein
VSGSRPPQQHDTRGDHPPDRQERAEDLEDAEDPNTVRRLSPDSVRPRFGFLVLLLYEDLLTLALVGAVPFVLLFVQKRRFVRMLLVPRFVLAHHAFSLRQFVSVGLRCSR